MVQVKFLPQTTPLCQIWNSFINYLFYSKKKISQKNHHKTKKKQKPTNQKSFTKSINHFEFDYLKKRNFLKFFLKKKVDLSNLGTD